MYPHNVSFQSLMQLWFYELYNRRSKEHTRTHLSTQGKENSLSHTQTGQRYGAISSLSVLWSIDLHGCSQLDTCHPQQRCLLE